MSAPAPALEVVTATDLFGGGGGATEGMTQAGVRVVIAANHWPTAIATHRANHPHIDHRTANLAETDFRTFPYTHICWVSPSCVWHARSGGRKRITSVDAERAAVAAGDPGAMDRATALAVIEAAQVHMYPVIIVENVAEFRRWALYDWWLDGLHRIGYTTTELWLDALHYGHAQHRPRLFIVATLDGVHMDLTPPPFVPVYASAIVDPDPGKPVTRRLSIADQIESIDVDDVPHLVTYRNHAKARRADRHALATVTAGGNHHAIATRIDGRYHHRMLTTRERARAQGFPDHYVFMRERSTDVIKQIGNAVPVGIARWFGERAIDALRASAAA